MPGGKVKKLQLKGHNFETTAIKFQDGRRGLSYHGETVWDDSDDWVEFIDSDWEDVWANGIECDFADMPEDMRIECPGCGSRIEKESSECVQCGIIFAKFKSKPKEYDPEETVKVPVLDEKKKSKYFDIAVVAAVVLIVAIAIYIFMGNDAEKETAMKTSIDTSADVENSEAGTEEESSEPLDGYDALEMQQDLYGEDDSLDEESENTGDFEAELELIQEASKLLDEELEELKKEKDQVNTDDERREYAKKMDQHNNKIKEHNKRIKKFKIKYKDRDVFTF